MVKTYELMILLQSSFTQEQIKAVTQSLEKNLKERGGKILTNQSLGKRSLAYPIQKQRDAVYMLYTLALDTSHSQAFERDIRLMPEVLRSLFIIKDEKLEAALKSKESATI